MRNPDLRPGVVVCCLVVLAFAATFIAGEGIPSYASAQQPAVTPTGALDPDAWPRQATRAGTTVLMYQPQLERLTQNDVEARAAVQITEKAKEPRFGAVWISAEVDIDRDRRVVTFRNIRLPRVRVVD